MRKVPEGQFALDFSEPKPREWRWQWHDPFPPQWTDAQCWLGQIARDMRAIDEARATGPGCEEDVAFFEGRIELFRKRLREAKSGRGEAESHDDQGVPLPPEAG